MTNSTVTTAGEPVAIEYDVYGPFVNQFPKKRAATASSSIKQWSAPAEQWIGKNPALALASAFLIGVAVAWWIKRK
jgi:hypothetical protein